MPTRNEIESYASQVADKYGISPSLALAVIETESSFRQDAIGSSGEVGLMQLMPTTAAELGVDPYDWRQNIEGGISYLAQQINRFGNVDMGVAAYNAGPGNVSKGIIPDSTRDYISKIFGIFSPTESTTVATTTPTFQTSTLGLSNDLLWLLAMAAGALTWMVAGRR